MQDREKRKKRAKSSSTIVAYPLYNLSRQGEKRKEPEPDSRLTKDSQKQRREAWPIKEC